MPASTLEVYARSLCRLKNLPVQIVHAGHDPSFGYPRMVEIIDHYLGRWGMESLRSL